MAEQPKGLERFVKELWAETKRHGVQGAAELAQALFSGGNSYVPYGRGQGSSKDHDHGKEQTVQGQEGGIHGKEQPQQERGGREM